MSQMGQIKYEHSPQQDTPGGLFPVVRDLLIRGFSFVPQNFLSWVTGGLSRVEWPRPLRGLFHTTFIQFFKINMSEAEHPIEWYKSIEEIFTRKIKYGRRPIQGTWISPSDGYLVKSEAVKNDQAIQAKGLFYNIYELIGENAKRDLALAWYQTVYLAPHNYHRVHAPCDGELVKITYVPGQLWPVNNTFIEKIPKIFTRNERLIFQIRGKNGGTVWVVMVGAFNVGRMTSPYAPFLATNSEVFFKDPHTRAVSMEKPIIIGEELGTFMLGSTVIIVLDQKSLDGIGGEAMMVTVAEKTPVQMGQRFIRGAHD